MENNYNVTKDIILATELPQQTRSYKPVSHQSLIDLTMEGLDKAGFTLDKELYTSANGGKLATARYTITNVADNEMQLQLGWQNSYDKTASLKLAIGVNVLICQNGCVHGDFGSFKKKHVGDIQTLTPEKFKDFILGAGDVFQTIQQDRDLLKNIYMSDRVKAELLGRMFIEDEIIGAHQLSIIKKELQAPTYDYNAKDSAWELYQYCTYAAIHEHPIKYFKTHADLHTFFTELTH